MMKDSILFYIPSYEDFAENIEPIKKEEGAIDEPTEVVDLNEKKETAVETGDKHVDIVVDVGNRSVEAANYRKSETDAMLAILHRSEMVGIEFSKRIPGTESEGDFLSNALYGVVNVVGHVVSNFSNLLFRGWRDFKRGELRAYLSSNVTLLSRIDDESNYNLLNGFKLYIPEGMVGKYADAYNSLIDYLDTLNMEDTVDSVYEQLKDILNKVKNGNNSDFNRDVVAINKTVDSAELNKKFKNTEKYFTTKKVHEDVFQKQFSSMNEFADLVKNVVYSDSILRGVSSIYSTIEKIENVVKTIYKFKGNLNKNDISALASSLRLIATSIDNYATCVNDISRVQHNLCENIKAIRSRLHY